MIAYFLKDFKFFIKKRERSDKRANGTSIPKVNSTVGRGAENSVGKAEIRLGNGRKGREKRENRGSKQKEGKGNHSPGWDFPD